MTRARMPIAVRVLRTMSLWLPIVLGASPALATPQTVATGILVFDINASTGAIAGTASFDPGSHDVSGTTVDVQGALNGQPAGLSGNVLNFDGVRGSAHLIFDGGSAIAFTSNVGFDFGTVSFSGTLDAVIGLPASPSYTITGSVACLPPQGGLYPCQWPFTLRGEACGNGVVDPGEACDDGLANGAASSCCSTACLAKSCSDGNACTLTDTCQAGVCVGSNSVVCAPADACHVAGMCDPGTGHCSNPSQADGTTCVDGNGCTVDDACHAGVCLGVSPTCGNGQVEASCGEQCDGTPMCSSTCRILQGPVATGTLVLDVSGFHLTGSMTFDARSFGVLGTTVNLGDVTGSAPVPVAGDITQFDGSQGSAYLDVPTGATTFGLNPFRASGSFICGAAGCPSGQPNSFVDTLSNPPLVSLPSNDSVAYTLDGAVVCNSAHCVGPFTISGFAHQNTPASPTPVTTTAGATFIDPLTGTTTPLVVDVTFPSVTDGGTTVVTALSNVAAAIPYDVTLDVGGYHATFFDVSTTATVTRPITICFHYIDGPPADGILDGTTVSAAALRVLHRDVPGGPFVEHATTLATDNRVCADVDGLSPFVVAVATAVCGDGTIGGGEQCDDGPANGTSGSCCTATCEGRAAGSACAEDGNPCTADMCDGAQGAPACTHPARSDGTSCDDGDACTRIDTCQAGACTGGSSVVCAAADQCHVAGTCNPATGWCSNPAAADGTACSDGSGCTQTDVCRGGSCVGANFSWSGVLQPINGDGSSIFKLDRTVPVKFKLQGACAGTANLNAHITLAKLSNAAVGTYVEATSTSAADAGNTFRYDASADQYIFNLSTKSLSQGTWQIAIDLGDGSGNRLVPLISLKP